MDRDRDDTDFGRATAPLTQPEHAAAAATELSLGPGSWLKHYEIIRELGRGGMGRVFLARDTRLARLCAIKLLHAYGGERAARFLAEARATARCRHEHIVGIYEVDEVRGCPYMVLEYLDGRTLRAWLDEREPLSPRQAAERMLPVVRALECAHAMGIVHRDLKPENVLVTDAGQVKVLDFGVAKRLAGDPASWRVTDGAGHPGDGHTLGGDRVGTPAYMSPEQWLGEAVDARTDVWAAGVVLHELLTGVHPLAPVGPARLAGVRDLAAPMPSLAAARPDLGPIADLVDACLIKDRERRLASAALLVRRLEALVADDAPSDLDAAPFAGLAAFQEAAAARFFGRERDTAAVLARLRQQQLVVIAGPSGAGKSSLVRAGLIPALKRSGGRWDALVLRPGRRPLAALADVLAQFQPGPGPSTPGPPAAAPPRARARANAPPRPTSPPRRRANAPRASRRRPRHPAPRPPRRRAPPRTRPRAPRPRPAPARTRPRAPHRHHAPARTRPRAPSRPLASDCPPPRIRGRRHTPAGTDRRARRRRPARARPRGPARRRRPAATVPRPAPHADALAALLPERPGHAGALLRAHCRAGGCHLLLFVDQFEELYTLGAAADERATFLACLESAADDAASPVRVVLAVRSDFLDRVAEDRRFTSEVTRGLVLLPPLGPGALRDALVRPVEAAGYRFEGDDLVDEMLAALASTRCPLPLLQFTAARLWDTRDPARRLLTRASYRALGGVAGALSTHADAVLATLSPREQQLARAILLRLVTPERTRAVFSLSELRALAPGSDAAVQVVQHLAAARLLLIAAGDERDGGAVELVHESLIERWARLRQWLDESRQDARFVARLRAAAQQWRASGRAEGTLWREHAAEEARVWLDRRRRTPEAAARLPLGPDEEQYLAAVVARLGRAEARRRRRLLAVIAALVAIAGVVSWLALRARAEALRARDEALRAEAQAARADVEARQARNATRMAAARELELRDPTTALALVRELEPPDLPREWADLALRARDGGLYTAILPHPVRVEHAAFAPDERSVVTAAGDHLVRLWQGDADPRVFAGHTGKVCTAAFSPDGRAIVSASADRTVRVWSLDGGDPRVLRGHDGGVTSAVFSPDGRRIVSASADHTVRVWPVDGGDPLILRGHENAVLFAAWSPDGRRIASTGYDRTTRVWSAERGELLATFAEDTDCYSVDWSPDGARLVVGCNDDTARIWNVDSPAGPPRLLVGHEGPVMAVAWRGDGRRVLTGSYDATIRVWPADDDGPPQVLRGHEGAVHSLAWSRDGRRILAGSWDRSARVWRPEGRPPPRAVHAPGQIMHAAAFGPDGRIAFAENDRVRVWDPAGEAPEVVLRGHAGPIYGLAWSPGGGRLATASTDATARVWHLDGRAPQVLRGHGDWLGGVGWSPDGRRLATASGDRTARIWDLAGGRELAVLSHDEAVNTAAWSPDGARLLTASLDKTARVWGSRRGDLQAVLRGHHESVMSAAWSPDGRRVLTTSEDMTARIWDPDAAAELAVLRGHVGGVPHGAWSPDGRWIATASKDRTVRVWPADGAGDPLVLRGHDATVYTAHWAPDGRRIVSASQDGSVRVWTDLETLTGVDDPKLWSATRHCVDVERRVALLNVSAAAAAAARAACSERVALAGPAL
ncbi:serine/threonine-protein kinase [Nannocystis exedens]|uniref:serine/threonine-protein kinase n=1 Tax=Nannocystis exedens TaxID=54 RepID=UPI000BBA07D2|nr:serine/threonine-protein kinase [Nannocystis exedens]PCC73996.1 protein kinase [Nannocystis exedens]